MQKQDPVKTLSFSHIRATDQISSCVLLFDSFYYHTQANAGIKINPSNLVGGGNVIFILYDLNDGCMLGQKFV